MFDRIKRLFGKKTPQVEFAGWPPYTGDSATTGNESEFAIGASMTESVGMFSKEAIARAEVKKPGAKRPAAKKSGPAKKTAAKRSTAKKTAPKKAAAKKSTAKKTAKKRR